MLMFVEILKLMLGRDSEDEIWSRFMFELVIWLQEFTLARWTQPSGPLCLWQCFKMPGQNHQKNWTQIELEIWKSFKFKYPLILPAAMRFDVWAKS